MAITLSLLQQVIELLNMVVQKDWVLSVQFAWSETGAPVQMKQMDVTEAEVVSESLAMPGSLDLSVLLMHLEMLSRDLAIFRSFEWKGGLTQNVHCTIQLRYDVTNTLLHSRLYVLQKFAQRYLQLQELLTSSPA